MKINTLEYFNNYKVELLLEDPKECTIYKFLKKSNPQADSNVLQSNVPSPQSGWLSLKIKNKDGTPWFGEFAPGMGGLTGLFATPCDSVLCVVVKGEGYWVNVESPEEYEIIPVGPIKQVFAVPDAQIMIFVDFVRLAGYGPDGLMWHTPSLSWDGISISEIKSTNLEGKAWDAPNDKEIKFTVNALDGTYKGGSSPELNEINA